MSTELLNAYQLVNHCLICTFSCGMKEIIFFLHSKIAKVEDVNFLAKNVFDGDACKKKLMELLFFYYFLSSVKISKEGAFGYRPRDSEVRSVTVSNII